MLVWTGRKPDLSPVFLPLRKIHITAKVSLCVFVKSPGDEILHSLRNSPTFGLPAAHSREIFANQLDVHEAMKWAPLLFLDLYYFCSSLDTFSIFVVLSVKKLAVVINKNKRNDAGNNEKVVHPCSRARFLKFFCSATRFKKDLSVRPHE